MKISYHNFLEGHMELLYKYCHKKDCKNFRACPMHCKCENYLNLNLETSIAWEIAQELDELLILFPIEMLEGEDKLYKLEIYQTNLETVLDKVKYTKLLVLCFWNVFARHDQEHYRMMIYSRVIYISLEKSTCEIEDKLKDIKWEIRDER